MMPRAYIQQQHRNTAIRALESAHVREQEKPLSGWLIAAVVIVVLLFGFAIDAHKAISAVIQ